jgi:hypothetical protein
MPTTWNVQPYQFLSELRYSYIQAMALTTRKEAMSLAKEAEAWMKENAPWKDETGRARKGLRARVQNPLTTEQQHWYGSEKRKAIAKDILTKGKLNAARKAKGQIKLAKVPARQSAVAAINKELNRLIGPVVTIRFSQTDRLKYTLWLEIANQGRFSILRPALDRFGPQMMTKVRRIANLKQFKTMDLRARLEQPSEEAKFQQAVRSYEKLEGKPYRPWSPQRQAATAQRRADDRRRARNRARK